MDGREGQYKKGEESGRQPRSHMGKVSQKETQRKIELRWRNARKKRRL